jgi:intracellular septation protein
VFWIFASALLLSQWATEKPIMQRLLEPALLEKNIAATKQLWKHLNHAWCFFFAALGGINLYVAYYYSNDTWVNFKFYGVMGATFVFAILQSIYLSKHLADTKHKK